ncbi:MAG: M23 family metallopeptidase [Henriciella sp.]|nr:M23 family metallopeptidase [Henriciella sp.]
MRFDHALASIALSISTLTQSFTASAENGARCFILESHQVRALDAYGAGGFNASRGSRVHQGLDYLFDPGEIVTSPVSGTVLRIGVVYLGTEFKLVEIETKEQLKLRILYVEPSVESGQSIEAGQLIGRAQNIGLRYPGITPHVHIDATDKFGVRVDPRNLRSYCR